MGQEENPWKTGEKAPEGKWHFKLFLARQCIEYTT